jgi:hypothetical protein
MRTFTGGRRLLLYAKIFLKSTTWSAGGTITLSALLDLETQSANAQMAAKLAPAPQQKRLNAPLPRTSHLENISIPLARVGEDFSIGG